MIVDGPTEEGAIRAKFNKLYNYSPGFRQGPGNGINYSVKGYINGVLPTVINLLSSDTKMIILLPDLEKRKTSILNFSNEIKKGLINEILKKTKYSETNLEKVIKVCPSNIMFENWIISDVEGIKTKGKLIKINSEQQSYDGKNGTKELEKIMSTKYKKTVHGKMLFKATRNDESAKNSPSYKLFVDAISDYIETNCNQ